MDRYGWKIATVESEVIPVSTSSDDAEELASVQFYPGLIHYNGAKRSKQLFFVSSRLRHSPFDLEKKEAGHRSKPMHGRDSHGAGFD
ncbi:hypothetical protein DAPPUDRAFT_261020 [Daphnia pulex]|uniref:Uncharacterized protein n=1 Tax=Daphnia pulex TaxID=6669 RepID=E9HKD7_DAPPU|nr:hypothetical protein DAPPUDRAFT_261020 [Daphnia pulex]|eukprot:EFX67767.1 hypothetical protein DAPPUDRAFT_261020 [Daphnia pulex]